MVTRPELDRSGDDLTEAVGQLVDDLQTGWDQHDADLTDRHLAADVLWGSPYGQSVDGFDTLHDIHVRLKQEGAGGPRSRFEVVAARAPAPDVVLAQVRRQALDTDDERSFDELALYVLVRSGETWWVAAGANTPVRR